MQEILRSKPFIPPSRVSYDSPKMHGFIASSFDTSRFGKIILSIFPEWGFAQDSLLAGGVWH